MPPAQSSEQNIVNSISEISGQIDQLSESFQ